MGVSLNNSVNRVFGLETLENQGKNFQGKVSKMYGLDDKEDKEYNPFLDKNGELVNKYINYQKVLDNPDVSSKAKKYISQATGLTPSQTTSENTTSYQNYTKNSNHKTGFISAKYETGGYDGGAVSSGSGDYGGVSYGIPQFSTKTGSADSFVSWLKTSNPEMANYFGNYKAGTTEFSNAWKQVYSKYGDSFSDVQTEYAYNNFVKPLADLAKQKTGIDYTRSDALKELLYSTAIQFGSGSLGLSALGNVSADMSDADIINASYDNKIANYKNYFKSSSESVQNSVKNRFINERNDVLALVNGNSSSGTGTYSSSVGKRVANTATYNNGAAKGQCVWYVRGRANEKLGKTVGSLGNANEMWYNAKSDSKLSATTENIKPNIIVSYNKGTSSGGQKYGHVIYIEDVVGDTVYYTEGGSGYYKNGTDGVVKTASKQGIIEGINSNGNRMGSGVIGFIDLSKY